MRPTKEFICELGNVPAHLGSDPVSLFRLFFTSPEGHSMSTVIVSNSSKWAGERPDTLEQLLVVLGEHRLNVADFAPFVAISRPAPGEPLKASVMGNFEDVSHVFQINSNALADIVPLVMAIGENLQRQGRWPAEPFLVQPARDVLLPISQAVATAAATRAVEAWDGPPTHKLEGYLPGWHYVGSEDQSKRAGTHVYIVGDGLVRVAKAPFHRTLPSDPTDSSVVPKVRHPVECIEVMVGELIKPGDPLTSYWRLS